MPPSWRAQAFVRPATGIVLEKRGRGKRAPDDGVGEVFQISG
jgi:hypothetical protein